MMGQTSFAHKRSGFGTLWVQTADGSVIDCDQLANLFRTDMACWGGNPTVASLGAGTYSTGTSVGGGGSNVTINPTSPDWMSYLTLPVLAVGAVALILLLKR